MKRNNVLVVVFILLLIAVVTTLYLKKKNGEGTFKSDLVKVDTLKVSEISFNPKSGKRIDVKLLKQGENWKVLYNGKTFSADENIIKSIYKAISDIKVSRIASNDKSKWKDFGVDTSGVKVIIKEDDDITAQFIVGNFNYNQSSRIPSTYFRLAEDEVTYVIEGYLSMMFNRQPELFRNKTLVDTKFENIEKVTFNYPGDSSYTINKLMGKWQVEGIESDSIKVKNYLSEICRLRSTSFVDDATLSSVNKPLLTLTIKGKDFDDIVINAYTADTVNRYFVTSSLNKESVFSGAKEKLVERAFVGKKKFLATPATEPSKPPITSPKK